MSEQKLYVEHAGTVRVKGRSNVGKTAWYIVRLLENKVTPIEVVFIGANAGGQAAKACSLAKIIAEEDFGMSVVFSPHRISTDTEELDLAGRPKVSEDSTALHSVKDAFSWEVINVTGIDLSKNMYKKVLDKPEA
jgi:stage V sporulation protein SpoVS